MAFRFLAYVRLNLSIQTGQVIKQDFVVQSWLGLNIQAKSTVLSRQIITLCAHRTFGVSSLSSNRLMLDRFHFYRMEGYLNLSIFPAISFSTYTYTLF